MIAELLEMIDNALLVVDAERTIIFANSRTEKMFAGLRDVLVGRAFSELFMPEDRTILVENLFRIVGMHGEVESEAMFLRRDDSSFLGRISGTRFHWNDSQEGIVFSIHDITDMKEIEKSLKQSERIAFLGRLVDDISHQIRNPIVAIGGIVRRLQAEHGMSRNMEIVLEEASRLEKLLDTLNRFTRLRRPVSETVRLGELAEEVRELVGAKVEQQGCRWSCHCDESIVDDVLLLDKALFLDALTDVALNACEAYTQSSSREERLVRCSMLSSDNEVYPFICRVEDCGQGIPAETGDVIFSHFYSEKTGHIGMGLTFAKRIIEEQGGIMGVESERGRGTTVSFHLIKERRKALRTEQM